MYDNFSNLDYRVYDSDIGKSIYGFNNADSLLDDQPMKQNSDSDAGKTYAKFYFKSQTFTLTSSYKHVLSRRK